MLQFYSASTNIVNSRRAITECLENAMADQPSLDCDLVIIYCSIGHNFKELLDEAHKLSPNAQIMGCTGSGVIGKEGPNESMRAIAIMAIKGDKYDFAVVGMDNITDIDPYDVGANLTQQLLAKNKNINIILFHPSAQEIAPVDKAIEGIDSVIGNKIPLIGGLAFDNINFISDFVFFNDNVFEKGAVMVGFADPSIEVLCFVDHGLDVIGNSFKATHSDKNRIYEINNLPCIKFWTTRLGLPESTNIKNLVFSPLMMETPKDLQEVYNSPYYIVGGNKSFQDGSFSCNITCPVGTKMWLSKRDEKKMFEGVDIITARVLEKLAGRKPLAVFHADCAARGKFSFNKIHKEEIISKLQYPICKDENIPWLGLYSGGEFAHLAGRNVFHLYTATISVIVKREVEIQEGEIQLNAEKAESSVLFQPSVINLTKIKNRFTGSATWYGMANHDGSCSPMLINTISNIVKNDIGMYITEMSYVQKNGQCSNNQLGVYNDNLLPGLTQLATEVHKYNTPLIMQLVHGGLCAMPMLTGSESMGPSAMKTEAGIIGREMTKDEISITIKAFTDAAKRAQKAGFDGVQVHAAHGWLISQFLSPYYNHRNDEYGGSLNNRARLLLEIISSVKKETGDKFLILVKLNSEDYLENGFCIDDMIYVSKLLEKAGVHAIEISGGNIAALMAGEPDRSFSPVSKQFIYYKEAATRYKQKVKIPLILVGGIRTFEEAEELVNNNIADYISLCRPLIREPNLIKRWKSGDLRKSNCISDSACFMPGMEGKGVHCVHVK